MNDDRRDGAWQRRPTDPIQRQDAEQQSSQVAPPKSRSRAFILEQKQKGDDAPIGEKAEPKRRERQRQRCGSEHSEGQIAAHYRATSFPRLADSYIAAMIRIRSRLSSPLESIGVPLRRQPMKCRSSFS